LPKGHLWFDRLLTKLEIGEDYWNDIQFMWTLGYHFTAWRPLKKEVVLQRLGQAAKGVPEFLAANRQAQQVGKGGMGHLVEAARPVVAAIMTGDGCTGAGAGDKRLFAGSAKYLFFLNPARYVPWDSMVERFYRSLDFDLRRLRNPEEWTAAYLKMIAYLHEYPGGWQGVLSDPLAESLPKTLPEGRRFDNVLYSPWGARGRDEDTVEYQQARRRILAYFGR